MAETRYAGCHKRSLIMFGLGFSEIIVILILGLIMLGPKKMPEVARMIAKLFVQFRRTTNEFKYNLSQELDSIKGNEFKQLTDFKLKIDEKIQEIKTQQLPQLISDVKNESAAIKPFDALPAAIVNRAIKGKAKKSKSRAKKSIASLELVGMQVPRLKQDIKLKTEVANAFLKMQEAANFDGFELNLYSGYRSFADQNRIWLKKYQSLTAKNSNSLKAIKSIIVYSSIPGSSRHHWGTDIDIVGKKLNVRDPLLEKNYLKDGVYYNLYLWLLENAKKYGFVQAYNNNKTRKGFAFEPWHFSYKKLSVNYLDCFLKINWLDFIDVNKINGLENLSNNFFKNYNKNNIQGIAKELLP